MKTAKKGKKKSKKKGGAFENEAGNFDQEMVEDQVVNMGEPVDPKITR